MKKIISTVQDGGGEVHVHMYLFKHQIIICFYLHRFSKVLKTSGNSWNFVKFEKSSSEIDYCNFPLEKRSFLNRFYPYSCRKSQMFSFFNVGFSIFKISELSEYYVVWKRELFSIHFRFRMCVKFVLRKFFHCETL